MSKTYLFPAYTRSDHPDVLASIEARNAARDEWEAEVKAFVKEHSPNGTFLARVGHGRLYFGGVGERPGADHGRWAKEGLAYRPAKNNPLYAEWKALTRKDLPILGMPSMTLLDVDTRPMFVTPFVFAHDGFAWAKASTGTAKNPRDVPDPDLWTEVKASEWHAASEAREQTT